MGVSLVILILYASTNNLSPIMCYPITAEQNSVSSTSRTKLNSAFRWKWQGDKFSGTNAENFRYQLTSLDIHSRLGTMYSTHRGAKWNEQLELNMASASQILPTATLQPTKCRRLKGISATRALRNRWWQSWSSLAMKWGYALCRTSVRCSIDWRSP